MKKILVFVFLVSLFAFRFSSAQNLYDLQHTKSFASYLYESGQFKLAAEECERWLYFAPGNDSASLMLLQSYRKSGMYEVGIKKSELLFQNQPLNGFESREYVTLLMLNKNFSKADSFLKTNTTLSSTENNYLRMNQFLFAKDWGSAQQIFYDTENSGGVNFTPYSIIFKEYKDLPHRSAGLAMCMSTVVPGTGKFYTGDWKDAIFSMLLIGASGFQSYRGFQDKGTKSVYGWVFGGLGVGLYFGNIYGSFKAAKDFNNRHENELLKKATDLFSTNL